MRPQPKPQIISPDAGLHNKNLDQSRTRLLRGATYKDVSTIMVVPTRGSIHARVLQSWFSLMMPMNQKYTRLFASGMEVGDAYSQAIDMVLSNAELQNWKYILTLEEDNMPPPDGLLKLYESINMGFDAVSGLYWTKGEGGQPMIYGDPTVVPRNFIPQIPRPNGVQPCNGLGMGFTLFKMEMLKDRRFARPLFRTIQTYAQNTGVRMYTQDLQFFEQALGFGYKFAVDTRVPVGHYDAGSDMVW